MKSRKRIIALICVLLITVLTSVLLCSCIQMTSSDSAYDIAVKNGFEGTEKEWLESLKGEDGKDGTDGTDGKDGYTIQDLIDSYLENNPGSTVDDFYASLGIDVTPSITSVVQGALKSSVGIICNDAGVSGSGIIYKLNGDTAYIITNYHVVYNSSTRRYSEDIDIYLYNRLLEDDMISATVVGASKNNDIAVLKATSETFKEDIVQAVTVNTSDPVAGQATFAIGCPALYTFSVTSGIVSVESEYITTKYSDNVRVYRTDAALNSGNSGGGMFNEYGELMGISDAKSSDTTDDNVCYAIPTSLAIAVADNIIENDGQKFVLGITMQISDMTTYEDEDGIIRTVYTYGIESVNAGSAAEGNLLAGDVLVSISINGATPVAIDSSYRSQEYLMTARPGDTVTVNVLRNGESVSVDVIADSSYFTAI